MKRLTNNFAATLLLILSLCGVMSSVSYAYIDPSTVGVLYQVLYLMFYGFLGILAFFFRPIKNFYLSIKEKITGKKAVPATQQTEATDAAQPAAETMAAETTGVQTAEKV